MRFTGVLGILLLFSMGGLARTPQPGIWLTSGQTLHRQINRAETQSFPLRLRAGQFLRITIQEEGLSNVIARLYAPDGKLLLEGGGADGFPDTVLLTRNSARSLQSLPFVAAISGVYRLDVQLVNDFSSGSFQLRLAELRAATPADKQRVAWEQPVIQAERWLARGLTPPNLEEALTLYQQALAVASTLSPTDAAELHNGLGKALTLAAKYESAQHAFECALAL